MHHLSRFARRRSFACSASLAAGLSFLLGVGPVRPGDAQDPQPRPSASSGGDMQDGSVQDGSMTGSSDNSAPSDNSSATDAAPQVGVDTAGHADAVATRSGRTTRQRRPAPANPLVLTDPSRNSNTPGGYGGDDPNADYPNNSANGYSSNPPNIAQDTFQASPSSPQYAPRSTQTGPNSYSLNGYPAAAPGNRLIPPVVTSDPGDYTISTDPSALGPRRASKPLPLFGYDFFQPARQIIVARRRSLLPAPRAPRYNNSLNRNGTRPGQFNNQPGSYNPNSSNPNTDTNANGSGGYGYGGSGYGADTAGSGASGQLPRGGYSQPDPYGQADPYGQSNTSDPNAYDPNNADLNGSGGQMQTDSQGTDPQAPSGYSNPRIMRGTDPNTAGGYSDGPDAGLDPSSTDPLPGDVTSTTVLRRRQNTNSSGTYQNPGDGFPGDAAPLGSDIQFPGDDALVQSGTANAVTGQIADPVSTLYRNVLASLPPNYQLQPGDSLTVRYSALALAPREFTTAVDLQGGINVEGVGRISVAGRTASEAEETLRQRLTRLYRNVDVSINLRQLRTIQVTVSGAAFAPGTYTVPATATAFNVLNAAGGPTADGSLRDIRVLRGGRLAGTLDIYPLIGAGGGAPSATRGDVALQAGDSIYIPGRLSRIAVRGEVRQQAVYELTPRETLRDALRYAGGVKPSGVGQNVHIDTIDNGRGRVIKDVNLADKAKVAAVPIFDGDTIEVSSVRSILLNRVTVSGEVDQPGDYALTPGMTVSDLIARARGPLYDAYLNRAELTRLNADNTTTVRPLSIAKALDGDPAQNIPLKSFDILRLYSRQEVAYLGRRLVTVRGAVQRPGLYTQSDSMHVSDLLLDSGGPLPDAYLNRAVLLHQRGDGTYAYEYVSLREILAGDTDMDLPIQDDDVLAIYRNGEAHFTPDHTVKVLGNVVAPGLYARGSQMKLSDLLKLAGAFKPGGGTRVTVAHARRPVTDKILQVVSVQPVPQTAVAYGADQTVTEGTDLVLQDGDVVAVQGDGTLRDHPAVVTVTGLVNRPGPIIIQQGMHLSDAIRQAGGLRPEAFPQGAEFTRTTDALVTGTQLDLATVINRMSDMLNLSQYQRERAKANLALIEAAGSAASGSSSSGLAVPGLGGAAASTAANPNLAPLTATLSQNNLVSPGRLLTPSQLRPNGAVAVQLAQALKRPGGIEDVLLKDGDTLVVPETPTTVQVVGAVFSARGVVYRPGQSIDYYIQRAGDYTPDAARDRIEVIHAGGGLIPASKAGALQPGDLILVPTKVLAEKIGRSGSGFSDFFQGLVGSAITLKVLSSVFGL